MDLGSSSEKVRKEEMGEQGYLFFRAGEYALALKIDSLVRVIDLSVDKEKQGIQQVDMMNMLGISTRTDKEQKSPGFQIVLKSDEAEYGLLVDSVIGIRNFQLAIPLAFPVALRNERNQAISSLFFDGENMICVMDAEKLVPRRLTEGQSGEG